MPYDLFQDGTDSSDDVDTSIDPRDTYGDRFQVTERSGKIKPKFGFRSGSRHFKSSDKLFSRHHNSNAGGRVNMKNVSSQDTTHVHVDMNDDNLNDTSIDTQVSTSTDTNTQSQDAGNITYQTQSSESDFRSAGLDSLFSSTVEMVNSNQEKEAEKKNNETVSDNVDTDEPAKKVKEASDEPRRVRIIKPTNFDTAASDMSLALKNGDAVVLSLKATNFELSKRILDFSFGAASMCGAMVSLDAERTYVFTIGEPLTGDEKLFCKKNGVLLNNNN